MDDAITGMREGAPLGSALMVAGFYENLDSVRALVKNHAAYTYIGIKGVTSIFSVAQSVSIKAWLLVGRFSEQLRLESEGPQTQLNLASRSGGCPWSGICQARLILTKDGGMKLNESRRDYAKRLNTLKKSRQGQVVSVPGGLIYPDVFPSTRACLDQVTEGRPSKR